MGSPFLRVSVVSMMIEISHDASRCFRTSCLFHAIAVASLPMFFALIIMVDGDIMLVIYEDFPHLPVR